MNLIREHIDYLKDNPEGYWFKCKLYGWGWTPAKKEGWVVTGVYIVAIIILALYAQDSNLFLIGNNKQLIFLFGGITILFLIIVWRTGEPLKWKWGQKKDDK